MTVIHIFYLYTRNIYFNANYRPLYIYRLQTEMFTKINIHYYFNRNKGISGTAKKCVLPSIYFALDIFWAFTCKLCKKNKNVSLCSPFMNVFQICAPKSVPNTAILNILIGWVGTPWFPPSIIPPLINAALPAKVMRLHATTLQHKNMADKGNTK